jgi:hypothetical protein
MSLSVAGSLAMFNSTTHELCTHAITVRGSMDSIRTNPSGVTMHSTAPANRHSLLADQFIYLGVVVAPPINCDPDDAIGVPLGNANSMFKRCRRVVVSPQAHDQNVSIQIANNRHALLEGASNLGMGRSPEVGLRTDS